MKQNVNPAVAAAAILFTLGIAAFLLWYSNRERPRPTHFGLPPAMQKMEDARASSFAAKPPTHGKTHDKSDPKAGAKGDKDSKDKKDSSDSKGSANSKENT